MRLDLKSGVTLGDINTYIKGCLFLVPLTGVPHATVVFYDIKTTKKRKKNSNFISVLHFDGPKPS